jgi:hypothetical protein
LSDELDQLRIELGAKRRRSVGISDLTKIVFDLPTSVSESSAQSLRAHLVAQTTESWMFWFGLLEAFAKEHGHCRVPDVYRTDHGYRFGQWVGGQRRSKNTMELIVGNACRYQAGLVMDPLSDNVKRLLYLKSFQNERGTAEFLLR